MVNCTVKVQLNTVLQLLASNNVICLTYDDVSDLACWAVKEVGALLLYHHVE